MKVEEIRLKGEEIEGCFNLPQFKNVNISIANNEMLSDLILNFRQQLFDVERQYANSLLEVGKNLTLNNPLSPKNYSSVEMIPCDYTKNVFYQLRAAVLYSGDRILKNCDQREREVTELKKHSDIRQQTRKLLEDEYSTAYIDLMRLFDDAYRSEKKGESLTKEVNQKEEELINSNANFKELEKQKLKIKNLKQSISETEVLTTESKNAYSDGLKNFASNSAYIHEQLEKLEEERLENLHTKSSSIFKDQVLYPNNLNQIMVAFEQETLSNVYQAFLDSTRNYVANKADLEQFEQVVALDKKQSTDKLKLEIFGDKRRNQLANESQKRKRSNTEKILKTAERININPKRTNRANSNAGNAGGISANMLFPVKDEPSLWFSSEKNGSGMPIRDFEPRRNSTFSISSGDLAIQPAPPVLPPRRVDKRTNLLTNSISLGTLSEKDGDSKIKASSSSNNIIKEVFRIPPERPPKKSIDSLDSGSSMKSSSASIHDEKAPYLSTTANSNNAGDENALYLPINANDKSNKLYLTTFSSDSEDSDADITSEYIDTISSIVSSVKTQLGNEKESQDEEPGISSQSLENIETEYLDLKVLKIPKKETVPERPPPRQKGIDEIQPHRPPPPL